jgi:hypothetical protein
MQIVDELEANGQTELLLPDPFQQQKDVQKQVPEAARISENDVS